MKLLLPLVAMICCFAKTASAAELFAGFAYNYYDYRETVPEPAKSTEHGWNPIPHFELNVPISGGKGSASDSHYLNFQMEYSGVVNTTYDGTYNDAAYTPVVTTNRHLFTNYEFSFNFKVMPNLFVKAGYGGRTWTRVLTAGTEFKEIYSWNYIPVGIYFRALSFGKNSVGLEAIYKSMFNGKIQVIFSETVTSGDDTTLTLGNLPGYRFNIPLQLELAPSVSLLVSPYYEYSAIGKSNTGYNSTPTGSGALGYIYEPDSKTTQYGLLAMMGFNF